MPTPVVVIGAGPVGLAAAAHLVERGLEPLVLEAGEAVGAAVRDWSHIRLFSPWRFALDAAAVRLLEPTGWEAPRPTRLPTGAELVREYLEPLASTAALRERVRTGTRVLAVSREGRDKTRADRGTCPFVIRTVSAAGVAERTAAAVIDTSGTWGSPNPLGGAGLPALGEERPEVVPHLLGPLPDVLGADRARVAGRHVLVAGSGHSAANTLLALARLARTEPGTRLTWAIRGETPTRAYGGGDADGLPERGLLGSRLRSAVEDGRITLLRSVTIRHLAPARRQLAVGLETPDGPRELVVDSLAGATGFRPELGLLRELRLDLDPGLEAPRRLAPLIDPEHHSCGTVPAHGAEVLAHPEPGFFIAGSKSYGRAPTFLLATGYEQVRSIAAHLAGDEEDARRVALDLPETGVCSAGAAGAAGAGEEAPVLIGAPTGLRHGRAGT